jgi:hypothetical protein
MNLLLLTYYWPPCGGAAVQRWLRLSAEIVARGHKITVITTRRGDYPFIDPELMNEVASGVRVLRTYTPVFGNMFRRVAGKQQEIPYGSFRSRPGDSPLKRLLLWVRRNLVIPDARAVWNPFLYRAALAELRKGKHDVLITTGPPHSTHLVGHRLSKERGVPWIADFRDPWSKIVYLVESPPWKPMQRILGNMERRVCADAAAVLAVSEAIARELPEGNKHVVRNGFREREFVGFEHRPSSYFRIKYIGSLTEGRDLTPLLAAVEQLSAQGEPIRLSFIGSFRELPADWTRLYPHVDFENQPFLPHAQALSEAVSAEALVLWINRYAGSEGYLTMKLFEYVGSRTFVLGVGPTDCEAAKLLREYGAGEMVDYGDGVGIREVLGKRIREWKSGELVRNTADLSGLTAGGLAGQLLEIVESAQKKRRR